MDPEETGPENVGRVCVIVIGSSNEWRALITAVNREDSIETDSTETDPKDVGRIHVGQVGSNKRFLLNTAMNRRFP